MGSPANRFEIVSGLLLMPFYGLSSPSNINNGWAIQPIDFNYCRGSPAQSPQLSSPIPSHPPMVPAAFFLAKVLTVQRVPKFLSLALKNCTLTTPQLIECLENMVQGLIWLAELLIKQKPKYCEVNVICCNLFWSLQPSQSALVGLPSLKWLDFSAKQKTYVFFVGLNFGLSRPAMFLYQGLPICRPFQSH